MARAIPGSASHFIVSQYVYNEEFYTERERDKQNQCMSENQCITCVSEKLQNSKELNVPLVSFIMDKTPQHVLHANILL